MTEAKELNDLMLELLENGHCTQERFNENKENEKKLEEHLNEVAERAFEKAIIVNIAPRTI